MSSSTTIIIFVRIISLSFFFIFPNFEVKQCANIYWKYDNTGFAMEKKPNFCYFSKWQIPHIRAKHNAFIEMKMTLHLKINTTNVYKRERERFVVLTTSWKNDNSSCYWYTNSFNWKSSFVLIYYKSEEGYPNFLFSYLLLIALYSNSTYIIWLKKYAVVFYFLNFLHVITFCSLCHHLQ